MTAKKPDLAEVVKLPEECRRARPGAWAPFGLQLVAVFNRRFEDVPFPHQVARLLAAGIAPAALWFVLANRGRGRAL